MTGMTDVPQGHRNYNTLPSLWASKRFKWSMDAYGFKEMQLETSQSQVEPRAYRPAKQGEGMQLRRDGKMLGRVAKAAVRSALTFKL